MTDVGFKDANWAYELDGPVKAEKSVLVAICHHTDDKTHETVVGQDTIAKMLGIGRSTVFRAFTTLKAQKIITCKPRHRKDGTKTSDLTTVNTSYQRVTVTSGHDDHVSPRPRPSVISGETDSHGDTARSTRGSTSRSTSRGTRLDPNWMPGNELIAALKTECPNVDQRREHAVFVDYWISQPGQRGVKLNWDATYRNWIRRAAQRSGRGYRANPDEKAQRSRDTGRALAALAASEQKGISA